ncbi:MAG: phosphorylase [Bacteroidetes bacterium]|nr:MAG: phosphorylase [Bacteroidota bacterium]
MKRIAESELILNSRGAVYHLDLLPHELADTIITVGDPDRVAQVSRQFDSVEVKQQHREFVTHTGYVGTKRISVVSTGIGTDNIDIVWNELDALVNINLSTRTINPTLSSLKIVRIGTCGGLQGYIDVDDFVVGTHGIGLDNLLNYYRLEQTDEEDLLLQQFVTQTQLNSQFSSPYLCAASVGLLKHFVAGFHQGITVTCPGFYGPQGRVLRLGLRQPDLVDALTKFNYGPYKVVNFEMETSAMYGLSRLLGHAAVSLNVVVANRVTKKFSKNASAAVDSLIALVLEQLAQIKA